MFIWIRRSMTGMTLTTKKSRKVGEQIIRCKYSICGTCSSLSYRIKLELFWTVYFMFIYLLSFNKLFGDLLNRHKSVWFLGVSKRLYKMTVQNAKLDKISRYCNHILENINVKRPQHIIFFSVWLLECTVCLICPDDDKFSKELLIVFSNSGAVCISNKNTS